MAIYPVKFLLYSWAARLMLVVIVARQTDPFCSSSQAEKNLQQRPISVCCLLNCGWLILFSTSLCKVNPTRTKAKISVTTYILHEVAKMQQKQNVSPNALYGNQWADGGPWGVIEWVCFTTRWHSSLLKRILPPPPRAAGGRNVEI